MLYCNLDEAYSNSASFSTGKGDNAALKDNYTGNGIKKLRLEDEEYAANMVNIPETVSTPQQYIQPLPQQIPQLSQQFQNSQLVTYPGIHNNNKHYGNYQNPYLQNEDLGLSYGLGSEDETIVPIRRRKRSHPYYINKFLNSFTDDDLMSLASNYDNDMYRHIVACKYCRMKINYEMKKRFLNELANVNNTNTLNNTSILQHFDPNLGRMSNVVNTVSPITIQEQVTPILPTTTQTLPLQQQTKEDFKYDHYLMIIVVIVLILFLLVDIVLKIVK